MEKKLLELRADNSGWNQIEMPPLQLITEKIRCALWDNMVDTDTVERLLLFLHFPPFST